MNFDPLFQMLNGCVRLIARVTSSSLACRRMSQSLADSPAFQVNNIPLKFYCTVVIFLASFFSSVLSRI